MNLKRLAERLAGLVLTPVADAGEKKVVEGMVTVVDRARLLFPEAVGLASGEEVELVSDHEFQVKGITLFGFRWIVKLRLREKGET